MSGCWLLSPTWVGGEAKASHAFSSQHTYRHQCESLKMHVKNSGAGMRQTDIPTSQTRGMKPEWQDPAALSEVPRERCRAAVSDGRTYKCVMEEEEEASPPCFVSAATQTEMADFMVRDIWEQLRVEWERIMAAINLLVFFFLWFCVGTAGPGVLDVFVSWALGIWMVERVFC